MSHSYVSEESNKDLRNKDKSIRYRRSKYGNESIAKDTINEERQEKHGTKVSSIKEETREKNNEKESDNSTVRTNSAYSPRRGKGNGRYQFDGSERSVKKAESMTTYDYDSDDYEEMASRKSGAGLGAKQRMMSKSSAETSYDSSDDDDDNETFDKSLISRTVNKMTEGTKKKNRSGKEDVLRKKHTRACKYLRDGNYPKSLRLFEEILSGLVEKYDKTHHRVATAMHNIGIVHLRAGDLDLALDAINVAVRIREDAHGPKHPKVADSLVELGIILLSRREFEESLSIFNEALALREEKAEIDKHDKKVNLQVAKVLNNIGCVYFEYGELCNALGTFEEALDIQKQYLGADDPTVEPGVLSMASTMCNIAYVHIEQDCYRSAIYMLEQALQIQEAVLEADNKLVLNTLDNLGYTYYKDGSYDDALRNYEEILDTQTQAYGPKHIDCAITMKKTVCIHMRRCQFEKSLDILMKVMAIEVVHYRRNHKEIQETSRMINEMNYQLLKFPNIWEAFVSTLKRKGWFRNPFTCRDHGFTFLGTSDAAIDISRIEIKPPQNSSKMAGHKVAFA